MLHVARAFRVSGDVRDDAEQRAIAVVAPFQVADNLLGRLAAITNLARLQVLQGRLRAAAATYREMTQIAAEPDQPLLLEGPAYDEFAEAPTVMQQAQGLTSLGDKPLMVLTAVREAQEGWLPAQDKLATLSTNSSHRRLPNVTHASLIENQNDASVASQAIREVVVAVRAGTPLAK